MAEKKKERKRKNCHHERMLRHLKNIRVSVNEMERVLFGDVPSDLFVNVKPTTEEKFLYKP